jgi:hypothetical protein
MFKRLSLEKIAREHGLTTPCPSLQALGLQAPCSTVVYTCLANSREYAYGINYWGYFAHDLQPITIEEYTMETYNVDIKNASGIVVASFVLAPSSKVDETTGRPKGEQGKYFGQLKASDTFKFNGSFNMYPGKVAANAASQLIVSQMNSEIERLKAELAKAQAVKK